MAARARTRGATSASRSRRRRRSIARTSASSGTRCSRRAGCSSARRSRSSSTSRRSRPRPRRPRKEIIMVTQQTPSVTKARPRGIAYRTKGHTGGPITRLMSPGDLGALVKPFVFLDRFEFVGPSDGGVVHPHSGIATHTTLLEGDLLYGDSTGKSGRLRAGSVEWMVAGGGVWHGGTVPPGRIRGFQLWMAMEGQLELAPAESHYVDVETIPADGHVRVLLGSYGELN